jgi:hypothetical protein
MKNVLLVAAAGEAAIGLALLIHPPIVVRLLFAADIAGAGVILSRIAGICLIALGIACWPGTAYRPLFGMLTYSAFVTVYLANLGIGDEWAGKLLWPAVTIHAVLTIFLARAWYSQRIAGMSPRPTQESQA